MAQLTQSLHSSHRRMLGLAEEHPRLSNLLCPEKARSKPRLPRTLILNASGLSRLNEKTALRSITSRRRHVSARYTTTVARAPAEAVAEEEEVPTIGASQGLVSSDDDVTQNATPAPSEHSPVAAPARPTAGTPQAPVRPALPMPPPARPTLARPQSTGTQSPVRPGAYRPGTPAEGRGGSGVENGSTGTASLREILEKAEKMAAQGENGGAAGAYRPSTEGDNVFQQRARPAADRPAAADRWQKGSARPAGQQQQFKLTLKKDLVDGNSPQPQTQKETENGSSVASPTGASPSGEAQRDGRFRPQAMRPQTFQRAAPTRPLPFQGAQAPTPPAGAGAGLAAGVRDRPAGAKPAAGGGAFQRPGAMRPARGASSFRKGDKGPGEEGKPRGAPSLRRTVSSSSEEVRGNRRSFKAQRRAQREEAAKAAAPVRQEILEVGKAGMSVPNLAHLLAVHEAQIVRMLFMKGVVTTVNQVLDLDMVKMVCAEHEVEVLEADETKVEDLAKKQREFLDEADLDSLVVRPPVVTVMGHVDHGKTSLLDYIRQSQVAAGEAGGITQAIGAYRVPVKMDNGEEHMCVFLDTPGHEAFSAMRARGARVTDIAIIVVAADDGIRPQTLEAIAHARAANVPMVVAINKIDKEGANADRVMQELSAHGVMPEDWGGETPIVPVSALTGENVDKLLETLMLVAEIQELQANPDRAAVGTVIEAQLDKYRGPLATLLVQNGTLKKGDVVLCGETYGKVRALLDDTGAKAESAAPSTAVEVLGLSGVPMAGDEFHVVDSLEEARRQAEEAAEKIRSARLAALQGESKVTLAALAGMRGAPSLESSVELHSLNVILKVDCQGSVEAIRESLQTLPQDSVSLRFLLQAPGDVTLSDVDLAVASKAVILCFNVSTSPAVEAAAGEKGVEIRNYKVIYDIIDDVRKAMEGLLGVAEERKPIGSAEVRAVFFAGSTKVAGCMVTDGKLLKGCGVSVTRGGTEVHVGTLDSLRRVKELAKEVAAGLECGVGVNDFDKWQEGDIIEAFELVEKVRTLEDASLELSEAVEKKVGDLAATADA